jgi:serine/threonine-protein kinase
LGTQESIVRSPALSPDGRRVAYSSSSQLRVTPIDGGGSQTVADTVSPTSGGIAWLSPDSLVFQRSFGQGLRVVAARGGRSRVLTTVDSGSTADHRWPQALPGGRFVVFTIWSGAYAPARIAVAAVRSGEVRDLLPGAFARYDGSGHLVFVGPGGALQRVAFDAGAARLRGDPAGLADSVSVGGDGAAQFALSRTGTLALIRSVRVVRPVLVDKSGGVTTVRGIAADLYASPRYAPGARQFVVEQLNGDIWVDNFDTQTWSRVTDGGGFYSAWTPDAKRIYFARDEQAEVNIYSVPVDRSEPRRPELVHHGQVRTQDISHDGKYLLLRQNVGTGQYDLLSLALDSGATPTPWLASPSLERAPTFSPDDRWVAYSSDESGREEIYVRPFPGPGGRVPVSVGGGTEPAWSTDGHELYYRSGDSLLAVRVESRAAFRVVSPPRAILRGDYYAYPWARQYDVNPDGRHFLFLRFDTPVTDLTVVVNWVRRLQAP